MTTTEFSELTAGQKALHNLIKTVLDLVNDTRPPNYPIEYKIVYEADNLVVVFTFALQSYLGAVALIESGRKIEVQKSNLHRYNIIS